MTAESITYNNVTTVPLMDRPIRPALYGPDDDWLLESPPQFLPYWFEDFDRKWWLKFSRECWYLSVGASVLYILAIFSIQAFMRNREALNLKKALFVWNATLGIFSIIGFIRFIPEAVNVLANSGLRGSLCYREGLNMPLAYWS